jgi:hypothetical protein
VLVDRHDNAAGMKVQRRRTCRFAAAVNRVAEDGPAQGGAMDAELVRASGQRLEFKKRERPALWRYAPPEHVPSGLRRQTKRIDLHPPAAAGIETAEREIDFPLLF